MKHTYPSTLSRGVSEYIWFWGSISKTQGAVACFFFAPSGGRCPLDMKYNSHIFPSPSGGRCLLEMKYTYPSTLGHVVSEYIWLLGYISKITGAVACFLLHLQEGDALWK